MTAIEKIYEMGKEAGFPLMMERASRELGFTPYEDYPVIVGTSNLGIMLLYQEEDATEFVFDAEFNRRGLWRKKVATHWHPQDERSAFEDLTAFMNNNVEYFKKGKKL